MPVFEGTVKEFIRYFGPRIRNVIQSRTRMGKRAIRHVCQKCGKQRELESIHAAGHERIAITERILSKHSDKNGVVRIDLEEIEEELVLENLKSIVGYMCHECHADCDPKVGRYAIVILPSHSHKPRINEAATPVFQ